MNRILLWIGIAFAVMTTPATAQNRQETSPLEAAAIRPVPGDETGLAGNWTYRSYANTTDLVGNDPVKALALIFGEGVFTFEPAAHATTKGVLDMGGGYFLDLQVTVREQTPLGVEIIGLGRSNTPTAGWRYDYNATLAHDWPNGVGQIPALVGTVIRVNAHGSGAAGYVASFVAVKHL